MMKKVLVLLVVSLLLVMGDAAMHGVVEKKHARKLARSLGGQTTPETEVFSGVYEHGPEDVEVVVVADVVTNIDNNNNVDDDDENLGYKNYGKGSDTETHRYFSSDKPYEP
ncbi:hypothetical protein SDJN03_25758, partial [Cucurbita argyrosperma subsp. sororia]